MSREKNFKREDVLKKAIPLFWRKGYAETSIQDLEKATSVNKSGLYSEFQDKEDIYRASLAYYAEKRGVVEALSAQPPGWTNIEKFLSFAQYNTREQKGCFMVYSLRDASLLSAKTQSWIAQSRAHVKQLVIENVAAETTKGSAESIAETIVLFFYGLAIEQNVRVKDEEESQVSLDNLMTLLKSL